jgi:predicted N-acetyltransferase YhbS
MIAYRTGNDLDLDQFIDVYVDSGLGERRPVDDRERMQAMLENANLVISAWDADRVVGICRSVTDWVYCTYLADLAVRPSHQGQGIGREMVRLTREATPGAKVTLLAAPNAVDYYPRIGLERHDSAWTLAPGAYPI